MLGAMAGLDLVGRLLSMVRNRDGQARALEPLAFRPAQGPDPRLRPVGEPEQGLQAVVAAKLLEGWLANRQQTLVPHTLNLGVLPPEQADLLIAVMAVAARADGQVDGGEARWMPLVLQRLGAGDSLALRLEEALATPLPLGTLLARIQDGGLAAHAYAAAFLAIERRSRANRAFLDYLGARMGLSPDVVGSLERSYRT